MLPEIKKPEPIKFPDQFSIQIIPHEIVLVDDEVHIHITYENGSYEYHHPSLELLARGEKTPVTITTTITPQNKTVSFMFVPKNSGVYAFRLKPFTDINVGILIEIHALSNEEDDMLRSFFSRLFPEPVNS